MTPTDHPHHHYSDAEMHNEDVAHEHSDVNIRPLLAFAAGLATVVIVSAFLMWILLHALESRAAERDPQPSPVAAPANQQPAGPRLLTNEPANLRKFRAEEAQAIEGYGWVDEKAGVAHVPIAEAKKLVIQHGLPVRAGATDDPREGTRAQAYGEASGGRAIPTATTAATPASPAAAPPPAGAVKK